MRRTLLAVAVLGITLLGVGCNRMITGRCDCTHDPAAAISNAAPGNPYPTVSPATANPNAIPETLPKTGR